MKDNKFNKSGHQTCGVNLALQHLPRGGSDMTTKSLNVYLRTFGWPCIPVRRDDFGAVEEDKWFGMNEI